MRLSSNPLARNSPSNPGESVCFRSNITAAGRRRRTTFAFVCAALAATVLVGSRVAFPLSLAKTFLAVLPLVAGSLFCWLQVTRKTCAVLAVKGAREKGESSDAHERVTDTNEALASKKVASSIFRDTIVFGFLLAFGLSWLAVRF